MKEKRFGIDAYHLKVIAIMTMLLDHSFKMFYPLWIDVLQPWMSADTAFSMLYMICSLGRITFPIFAYLFAEGCFYTSNKRKYLIRLFLFALLAELPFQLMICIIQGTPMQLHFGFTNVLFTFWLSAIAVFSYAFLRKQHSSYFLCLMPLLITLIVSYVLQTDYYVSGIVMVFLCYCARGKKQKQLVLFLGIILNCLIIYPILDVLMYGFSDFIIAPYVFDFMYTMLALIPIHYYNGQRGKAMKYVFYVFYPAHIFILVLLFIAL